MHEHPKVGLCPTLARDGFRMLFALIDRDIIVQDKNGVSDFAALRSGIDREPHRLVMVAFDLLFLDGIDLRREPLWNRREKLCALIQPDPQAALQFNDHYEGDGAVCSSRPVYCAWKAAAHQPRREDSQQAL